jgi:hypothetical protein
MVFWSKKEQVFVSFVGPERLTKIPLGFWICLGLGISDFEI